MSTMFSKIVRMREFFILGLVIICVVLMSFLSPAFLNPVNISALFLAMSVNMIVAVGMTVLMVFGSFDLSVGSVVELSGVVTALLILSGLPIAVAILAGVMSGALIGWLNGIIVAKIGVNPFMTTLAMMTLVQGLVLIISGGNDVSGLPQAFANVGTGRFLGIESSIWIMLLVTLIGDFLLRRAKFFRQYYYIGGNEKAAGLSGINVSKLVIIAFVLQGAFAALAGILLASRMADASLSSGANIALPVIAGVVIGGASLKGGEGTVIGAFLGIFLMTMIVNALNLLGVSVNWQSAVTGLVLFVAIIVDALMRRKEA
ncbi:ribose transport system permease protein RbsC [Peptococcaceae bacterium CEB3]|nr:ribose transport system permease protein RbsC [Peptococcaceae bacterium CEB3]